MSCKERQHPPVSAISASMSQSFGASAATPPASETPPLDGGHRTVSDERPRPQGDLRSRRLSLYHPEDRNNLTQLVCLVRQQLEVFVAPPTKKKDGVRGGPRPNSGVARAREADCAASDAKIPRKVECGANLVADGDIVAAEGKVGLRCVHCAPPDGVLDADVPCGAKRGRRCRIDPPKASERQIGGANVVRRRAKGAVTYPTSTSLVYQAVRNWQRHHLMACTEVPENVKREFLSLKSVTWQRRSGNESARYWEVACARLGLIDTECGLRLRRAVLEGTWTEEMGQGAARQVSEKIALGTLARKINRKCPKSLARGKEKVKTCSVESATKSSSACTPASDFVLEDKSLTMEAFPDSESDPVAALSPFPHPKATNRMNVPLTPSDGLPRFVTDFGSEMSSTTQKLDNTVIPVASVSTGGDSNRSSSSSNCSNSSRLDVENGQVLFQSEPLRRGCPEGMPVPEECPTATTVAQSRERDSQAFPTAPVSEALSEGRHLKLNNGNAVILLGRSESCSSPNSSSNCPVNPPIPIVEASRSDASVGCRVGPLDKQLGSCVSPTTSVSSRTTEELLERVRLARSLVHTIRELRELPPTSGSREPEQHELSGLGRELYELFAGQQPYGPDGIESEHEETDEGLSTLGDNSEGISRQQQKREKRAERRKYTPLRELGLPTSLCDLVSNLLDESGSYGFVKEVEEDLCLIEKQPDKFLFNPPSGNFRIPQHALYGRTKEISKLLEIYDLTTDASIRTNNIVLISGYPGTGKSSLIRSVQGQFIERGAKFVSGKFDAMRQMQPLSAVVSAFDDYCNLLARDTERIDHVREAVNRALGSESKALAKLVPNLHRVIGTSSEKMSSVQVSGKEARQRIMFLFRLLFRATCSHSDPIVIFLDDLQWADEVSLELMQSLVTDSQIHGLLFIGCYRDNEVSSDHPLWMHFDSFRRSGDVSVKTIRLDNLDNESVNTLLSDTLQILPRLTQSLAEVVLHKTGGNALFLVQLLVSLFDEGLLRFSLSKREWEWDIDGIRDRDIADNVVKLMTAKMLRLAPEVRHALQVTASFGAQCLEDVLHIIDRSPDCTVNIVAALEAAVSAGLMVKARSLYRFPHDQVQRAAYMLIPESEREFFHLRLGRLLRKSSSADEMEEFLFVVADQLHRGASLISDHDEKINLAQLSLMAGQKALEMSAFLPASAYFQAGIGLIAEDDWESHRELCLDLYNLCAEMECVLGHFDNVKCFVKEVLQRGRSLREKLRAYFALVQSNGSEANTTDAFAIATTVLGQLGETLPSVVTQVNVKQELMKTQALLREKTEDDLLRLETMQDASKRDAMRFFKLMLVFCYAGRQGHFALVTCRMVQLSLLYGVCRESTGAFACYGMLLCGLVGNTAGGYRFGKLALSLMTRFDARESVARLTCVVYGFINHWTEPIQSSAPPLKRGIEDGLSTGDIVSAMTNAHLYLGVSLASGKPLGPLMDEMRLYSKQMVEFNQNLVCLLNKPVRQATLNLLGRSADPLKLVGEEMDEDAFQRIIEEDGNGALRCMVMHYRMWLEYLFGEYELAAETAKKNRDVEKDRMTRFVVVCNHAFYSGLSAIAMARKEGRSKWVGMIDKTMTQMKSWATSAPWNCQHKLELMMAEHAYLEGNISEAAKAYECAVSTAKRHSFIHEQALALERAGIFYSESGDHDKALGYFVQAHACYEQWEAHSKAAHVKERYLQY